MAEYILAPFPGAPHPPIGVTVRAERTAGSVLVLRYMLNGDVTKIMIPAPVKHASRHDDLWQTTCFEAFVQTGGGPDYVELNFAPSTAWAAYHFAGYRNRLEPLAFPPPQIEVEIGHDRLIVTASVDLPYAPSLSRTSTWALGLTAVIEDADGTKSYWALAHAPGKPDFHKRDCFTARLAAPNAA